MGNAKYGTRTLVNQPAQSFGRGLTYRAVITAPPGVSTRAPGNGYVYYIFTSTTNFSVSERSQYVDVLVVGGGGGTRSTGAGSDVAYGGGGGGGVVTQAINLTPGSYTAVVGAGGAVDGAGGSSYIVDIANPGNIITQVALGGGSSFLPSSVPGVSHGSGGGASYDGGYVSSTPFTSGQGSPGGGNISPYANYAGGGGGGGAGGAGGQTRFSNYDPDASGTKSAGIGGNGGAGLPWPLNYPSYPTDFPANSPGFFGGGGGGGSAVFSGFTGGFYTPLIPVGWSYPNPATGPTSVYNGGVAGTGGNGGGGNGSYSTNPGVIAYSPSFPRNFAAGPVVAAGNGTANTGGGGGGRMPASFPGSSSGGNGGSGVIILRQSL